MKLLITAVLVTAGICCAPGVQAQTFDEFCNTKLNWPMPLPPTVGSSLGVIDQDTTLECLTNITATAPDGHDVMNDPVNDSYKWQINSMNPPAGTLVSRTQEIHLTVKPATF
ncbi:hypothetical protein [Mycobacterium sp.]|uniref:hypothetical protein n=1 Tax=Mycobacterium sp. TaxID=1785 RepID=UPI001223A045|nr:hypothetical protein [Mycobacterium sp.]TAM69156.1 MAG: hypothetical protein EPN51_09745 [Mycobacterium sp.]